jgi:alkanesulfonate monooxygenase SsuD/methylene tetrahydromethanopterin reductase-like flavin-dependent oxidoreductase (luciferase family)
MDACLEALLAAFRGEPFAFEGRRFTLRPKLATPGGPPLLLGGASPQPCAASAGCSWISPS